MERPPLAPIKHENSCLLSPEPTKSILRPVLTPTPSKQKINHSPFHNWANKSLSTFENDTFSPSRPMLSLFTKDSPSLRVHIKDEAGNTDISECVIPRMDAPPSPSFDSDFSNSSDRHSLLHCHEDKLTVKVDTPRRKILIEASENSLAISIKEREPAWKARLQFVDLFTFEIANDRVITTGFTSAISAESSSLSKVRRQLPTLPATPGFGQEFVENKNRVCSCKKSRCLKLYCECFAASELCKGCKCHDCYNDGLHEADREDAVERIKQRSVNAFAPKIVEEVRQDKTIHARGCRCKKSHCLKKYCECFQAGVKCGENCKCEDCHNLPSSSTSSITPRERRPPEISFVRNCASPPNRIVIDKSCPHSRSEDEEEDDEDSPSPRAKRPRMLDFNVVSTPVAATPIRHVGNLEQESPDRRTDTYGSFNMFGSPSCLFLTT